MKAGDPKAGPTWSRSDVASFVGLAVTLASYYFASEAWLSLLGALVFVVFAVKRLDLALTYVVLSSPFYLFPKKFGGLAFSLTEFTILACAVAAFVRASWELKRQGPSRVWRAQLGFLTGELKRPVILFLIAATISLFGSEFLKFSLREYRTVILEPALFYFLMAAYAREQRQVWRLIDAFLLLSLGVALFGIAHYYFVGMVEATDGVRRVLAIYHSPNALALFLGRSAPMFVALALFYPPGPDLTKRRAFYAIGGAVVLACLFITYSRGAWFGAAAGIAFVGVMRGRSYFLAVAGATGAIVAALIPLVGIDRLVSQATSIRRFFLWQSALAMIRDHPFVGVGLDNFLYQYPRYMLKEAWAEPNISHPHNLVLDYWTRLGILGLAALLWLQAKFWQIGLGLYRQSGDAKVRVLSLALMASMVDFVVHGLIDNSFFLIDLAVVFWLTYGSIDVMKESVV